MTQISFQISFKAALFSLAFVAATALPAAAGTLNYQNGQTQWEASACQAPAAPSYMSPNGSRSGNALSANQDAYNQYAAAVQQFLNCVATEANQDLANIGQQIGGQVQQVNAAWQQELAKKQAELQTKRGN